MGSDIWLTAEEVDGPQRSADGLSVCRLAADERDHGVVVLRVRGDIDLATVPVLREALMPVLEHQSGPVVVDLSEVSFVDSTGVHLLVETRRRLGPQNRHFAIVCREGGPVHRVLGLVGLLDVLNVYGSLERAAIGGDDILRSESRSIGRPTDAPAEPAPSMSPAHDRMSAG